MCAFGRLLLRGSPRCVQRSFRFFKRHYAAIQVGAGPVLVAMGVCVLTGELFRLNIEVQQFLDRFALNVFQDI